MVVEPSREVREGVESCVLAKHPSEEQVKGERLPSKRKHLMKGVVSLHVFLCGVIDFSGFFLSTTSKDGIPLNRVLAELRELFRQEEERWKRVVKAQLQMVITLSQDEARHARIEATSPERPLPMVTDVGEGPPPIAAAVRNGGVETRFVAMFRAPCHRLRRRTRRWS
ncbi:hypothetical protein ACLOJK_023250 [Asimina triloba]